MRQKLFFLVLGIFMSLQVGAQTFRESILYGDEAMEDRDYYTAAMYYRNALYLDSSSVKASWKYADAARLFNNYRDAEKYYSVVLDMGGEPRYPYSRFWLALMQKSNGRYSEAGENFKRFLKEHPEAEEYYRQKANLEIQACEIAPVIISKPLNLYVDHLLDVRVNTAYSDFNAQQLWDTALVFSSLRPVIVEEAESFIPNTYVSGIYFALASRAGWSKVREFDSRINAPGYHTANATFSADMTRMFFTRGKIEGNPQMRTELWTAKNVSGKWQKPERLPDNINLAGYTFTQPALSELEDFDVLYFVSDRPGGIGKLDIWYVIIKDGKYGEPVNLGGNINTPGDEITPFYHDSTATLYFSSDWHKGLGGFDIFRSAGALNKWTAPVNIGYPLNTGYNDIYFNINRVDNDGYLTSNRPGSLYIKSETCCNDIYYYEWRPEVKKTDTAALAQDTVTLEEDIRALLPLTLYFHNDEPNPRSMDITTKKNYKTTLSEYYDMKELYKDEYSKGLAGFEETKARKDIEDFFENYVVQGFTQLKLFSKLLLTDLDRGSKVSIMIKGYCSPLTSTEYNVNLAKRRIASLVNYLREYEEGVFVKYMDSTAVNGGVLRIIADPIGESTASPFVSDNPNDKRNSIYSRSAAFERKIQILYYESNGGNKKIAYPAMTFEETGHDFGNLKQGDKVGWIFSFTNTGEADLVISGVETSCGCTSTSWPHQPIKPGEKGEISVTINTDEYLGPKDETVTILSNTREAKTMLSLKANISGSGE